MEVKLIIHIVKSHHNKLKENLDIIIPGFDTEAIHQFRVGYKKLRAFLRMITKGKKAAGKFSISKELKECYHIAGNIRDMQLQQQRIAAAIKQRSQQPAGYLSLLRDELDKLKPVLSGIILQNPAGKNKRNVIAAIRHKFSSKKFRYYTAGKLQDVYSIITERSSNDADIHTVRKNLKDLFYNRKEFEQAEEPGLKDVKSTGQKYLDKFLDELGNFQDNSVAISLLTPVRLKSLNIKDRKILAKIKNGWMNEKRTMKRSLVKKIKSDLLFKKLRFNDIFPGAGPTHQL